MEKKFQDSIPNSVGIMAYLSRNISKAKDHSHHHYFITAWSLD